MKSIDMYVKVPQVCLKKNNTRIRRTVCYAAVLLGVAALLIGCPDSMGDDNGTPTEEATEANKVQSAAIGAITRDTITLSWTLPTDTAGLLGVTISEKSKSGSLSEPVELDNSATEYQVTDLSAGTEYTFTIATRYTASGKNNGTIITATSLPAIDADGDNLIDIISIERLNNMRYNLDLMDGRYKTNADDVGVQCGTAEDTPCMGYELTRNLDFADAGSYDNGEVNIDWRPNNSDPAMATNAGWEPIGSCNGNTDFANGDCGDNDDTPFAIRFQGNGYTISNLYARNTNNGTGTGIGLFGIVGGDATIDTVGIVAAFVYGSSALSDRVGSLVGFNSSTITASYATDSTVNGGAGDGDRVGALVGSNGSGGITASGTIAASYAIDSTADGGMGDDSVGGLVGFSESTIAASYAIDSTADGGMGNDSVGGLVGFSESTIAASYAIDSTADGGMGNDSVGGLVGRSNSTTIIASYATDSTANGGVGDDNVGSLVGWNIGGITASYASSSSTANGDADNDFVGGLVGRNIGTITASYATGTADGGADNDAVGGLVGNNFNNGTITASYATATADGGMGSTDTVGSLVAVNSATSNVFDPPITISGTITASYGFGNTLSVDTPGLSEGPDGRPSGVTTAAHLTAPSTAVATAVAAQWNSAAQGAWHFGSTTTDIPTLRYADYDGAGDTFGCGSDSMASVVIPSSVPNGMGGTITVTCGTTLLPGQEG